MGRDIAQRAGVLMDRVKVDLENCYGIRELKREFDFRRAPAFALYAPNGVMKSSLARTFQDAADGSETIDRIFTDRITKVEIVDETGTAVGGDRVMSFCRTMKNLAQPRKRRYFSSTQNCVRSMVCFKSK